MTNIFKISYLPTFYFTYWIISIAIIAVGHEFAHGIFARLNKIRLKSTGFGFIGPLLAAFVEVDEKQMAKKPLKAQLSVLAAGSSANFILGVIFLLIMNSFFLLTYAPSGVMFSSYALEKINISSIYGINGQATNQFYEDYNLLKEKNVSEFEFFAKNHSYFGNAELIDAQLKLNKSEIIVYSDSPAYKAKLKGAIKKIISENESFETRNVESLQRALHHLHPGEKVEIETSSGNYSLTLASHPINSSKAYLGIMSLSPQKRIISKILSFLSPRNSFVYYEPQFEKSKELVIFIYNLLFWIVFINFSVMFVNMLPFGIFDGGRFFYLSMIGLTKSKRKAEKWYGFVTGLMLFALLLMMFVWWIKAF